MALQVKNILWPTDFSPLSLAAIDCIRGYRDVFKAKLHVIHVCLPPMTPIIGMPPPAAAQLLMEPKDVLKPAEAQLKRLVEDKFGTPNRVQYEAIIGTPWVEVCNYARENKIDLIILATHGRTGLRHVMLGSVAERIVQHAPCPVLVVRGAAGASTKRTSKKR